MLGGLFFVGVGEEQDNAATLCDCNAHCQSCHPHREVCYPASFLGYIAQGDAHFCPPGAEDFLPFAHCLVVCCRQTIVCSHQTIVCSGHTIVWWEQTKCAKAFSLYHLAWNPRIFCWSEASTAYSGCFAAAAFSSSETFDGQMQRIEMKYASCKTNYGFMTKKRRNVFSKQEILYLCSELM